MKLYVADRTMIIAGIRMFQKHDVLTQEQIDQLSVGPNPEQHFTLYEDEDIRNAVVRDYDIVYG